MNLRKTILACSNQKMTQKIQNHESGRSGSVVFSESEKTDIFDQNLKIFIDFHQFVMDFSKFCTKISKKLWKSAKICFIDEKQVFSRPNFSCRIHFWHFQPEVLPRKQPLRQFCTSRAPDIVPVSSWKSPKITQKVLVCLRKVVEFAQNFPKCCTLVYLILREFQTQPTTQ